MSNEKAVNLIRRIKPNDRVTIRIPNGLGRNGVEWKEKTGRAVICNHLRDPNNLTVVLNMGGAYGTPGVACVENIVSCPAAERRKLP